MHGSLETYLHSICDAMDGNVIGSGTENIVGSRWGGEPGSVMRFQHLFYESLQVSFLMTTSITVFQSLLFFSATAFLLMR